MTVTWWEDEETARAVLDAVDDSDPDIGAGVVTLGLHGLGASALRRAAPALALDPGSVVAALDSVDLDPVISAWQRLGGEADDVALMKSDADVAAFRVIPMLRQAGLGPEQAVQRAASLYGLPPKPAVSAVAKFQADTSPAADSAAVGEIMHYAAGVGDDLVSKAYQTRGYHGDDPDERDEDGRFKSKGGAPPPPRRTQRRQQTQAAPAPAAQPAPKPKVGELRQLQATDRQARVQRRKRREARAAKTQAASRSAAQAASTSLPDLFAARRKERKTRSEPRVARGPARTRRGKPITARKWTAKDSAVGDDILKMPLNAPVPGGPGRDETAGIPSISLYSFVPLAVAQSYDGDFSLHAVGHAAAGKGVTAIAPGQVFTGDQAAMFIQMLAEDGAIDYVKDPKTGDEHLVVAGVPMALASFTGVELPMEETEDTTPIAHPGTMLTFQDNAEKGRVPSDSLDIDEIDEDGVSEPGQHRVQVFEAMNLHTVDAKYTFKAEDIGSFRFAKAYQTRGYHGDDPDERDESGRFAPKGAPRSASRGRLRPAAKPVTQTQPEQKPKVGQIRPLQATDRAERVKRRKKRQARQARQVAQTRQAAQATQARPLADILADQRRAKTETRGQARTKRGPARTRRSVPRRPPGVPRPPIDAPLETMLDLDRLGAEAVVITPTKDAAAWRIMQRLLRAGEVGGMEKAGNGWVARNLGQLTGGQPNWGMQVSDAPLEADAANTTEKLRSELTRETWRKDADDPVAAAVDAFEGATTTEISSTDARILWDALDNFDLDRTGTVVSGDLKMAPAAATETVAEKMGRSLGMPVSVNVTHVYDTDVDQLGQTRRKYTPDMDWSFYDAIDGQIVIDTQPSKDPPWLLIERVGDAAVGDIDHLLSDGSGLQVLRDEAATLLVRRSHVGQVADLLGMDRSDLRFPANLPINIAVLDHESGYAS